MIATIPITHLLGVSAVLFLIGLTGIMARRNLLFILISIEIMLNGVAVLLVGAGARWSSADGQILVLFLFVTAAVEVGIGLALFLQVHRTNPNLDADSLQELKG